jgi:hypothetical protein
MKNVIFYETLLKHIEYEDIHINIFPIFLTFFLDRRSIYIRNQKPISATIELS